MKSKYSSNYEFDLNSIAQILSIVYSAGGLYLFHIAIGKGFLASLFSGDFVGLIIGFLTIAFYFAFFISAYHKCLTYAVEWYEYVGIFSFIFCIAGVIVGPIDIIGMINRNGMEMELGYKDPNMSDKQVQNEYEKLQAIKKINRMK